MGNSGLLGGRFKLLRNPLSLLSVAGNSIWVLIHPANLLGPQRGPDLHPNFQQICRQGSGGTTQEPRLICANQPRQTVQIS